MQKLVAKLTRLGKAAPRIYKLLSHLYTSLAFALQSNAKLLEETSNYFRKIVEQIIKTKNFSCKPLDLQRHLNFVMKKAAKMINKNRHLYLINSTMQEELNFILQALSPD